MSRRQDEAFQRLLALVESDMLYSEAYGEDNAWADYLTIRPDADPSMTPVERLQSICALCRIWGEKVGGTVIIPPEPDTGAQDRF